MSARCPPRSSASRFSRAACTRVRRNPRPGSPCCASSPRPSTRRSCKSTAWSRGRARRTDGSSGPLSVRRHALIVSAFPIHEVRMRLSQSAFYLVAAALALAVGGTYAEDKVGKDKNDPGFHALDKNKDGYISREEAKGNPALAAKFKEADKEIG